VGYLGSVGIVIVNLKTHVGTRDTVCDILALFETAACVMFSVITNITRNPKGLP
jgi:hypothetical protein